MANSKRAARYELIRDFQTQLRDDLQGVQDSSYTGGSPSWCLAIVQLGRPNSFSRRTNKSLGSVVEGAFSRRDVPLVITSDAERVTVQGRKSSHVKSLSVTLKPGLNYLSPSAVLPGDWVLCWMHNNKEDTARVVDQVKKGSSANGFGDGLKFVGRVHNVRKSLSVVPGAKAVENARYSLTAIGFEELDTNFFYDFALATAAGVKNEIRSFMAQLGLDFSKWAEQEQMRAGRIKDNCDQLIETLIDIIIGKGVSDTVNESVERAALASSDLFPENSLGQDLKIAPQASKEAPFAYLVPVAVAKLLGRNVTDKSKAGVFGYADILDTLIGVQQFSSPADNVSTTFLPDLWYPAVDKGESTSSRKRTSVKLKGTFLPVNPSFVNVPLWQLLQQYLNPTINEMYTALRVDENGSVVPTLVARQIPFSTESIQERPEFPLTRFLSLPRWVVAPSMVRSLDIGTSNATRVNMVHVYGDASAFASNRSITNQMVRNPPIFDATDIQRSGIRPMMRTVSVALEDQVRKDGARIWMEAIADWTFGSQFTLNGHLTCKGIQSPVAEGDNIEFQGVAYHVEGITHDAGITPDGKKSFTTTLELSNGMPIDQTGATADFPRYPGFRNEFQDQDDSARLPTMEAPETAGFAPTDTTITGDDEFLTDDDPGLTKVDT